VDFIRILTAALLIAATAAAQEGHGVSPAGLERGMQIYLNSCAGCHGPEGDLVSGVNFKSGRFRRAQGDNELRQIVLKGIPGTPMPAGAYTDEQAGMIVAYLRSMATSATASRTALQGDASRGKSIVESQGCLSCHRIGLQGTVAGPDLSNIGATRRTSDLERSLIDPDAEIRQDNLTVHAIAKNGAQITGLLLNMDTYTLQILDRASERPRTLQKDQLREYEVMKKSPMPSYRDKLNPQQIADVLAYLSTLREKT
jgi:putative heme-binding domain-containing protein